jgi:hypothetical protein
VKYPTLLTPTTTQLFRLASGEVAVPKATPVFVAWPGQQPDDTYNGKQVLAFEGRPAFAELAVLWSLNALGWQGVWIDSYRGAYRTGYWDCPTLTKLPDGPAKLLERIRVATGSRFGAWDVFCWRDQELLMAECKRVRHDAIRGTQVRWLEAGLALGLSAGDFLIVEWSIAGEKWSTN